MFLGWLVLAGLSALALAAAVALAVRTSASGRAELGVTTALLWHALVVCPILALGWANRLTALTLAVATSALSVLALAASSVRRDPFEHARESREALFDLMRLPLDALRLSWERRSFVSIAVLASFGVLAWTACLSYLAPSTGWDGIWYHEMMVGYAIQNHGFRVVEIPPAIEHINGFPKVCESLNLWFVVFTDRRLIELPQTLMAVPLVLAFYVMARRFADRVSAMGWACGLLLMPGVVLELKSTYIDVHVAALLLIALMYCTRPRVRLRDAWLASLALGLLLGSKSFALVWVPIFALVAATRVFLHNGDRPWRSSVTVLGGAVLILVLGGPTYLRNWLVFHNPLWPIAINNERLAIHWSAPHNMDGLNKPADLLITDMLRMPVPGHDWPDTREYGYGVGIPWVALPVGAVGFIVAWCRFLVGTVRRSARDPKTTAVLLITTPLLATMVISPALWAARYNVHIAAAFLLLCAWQVRQRGLELIREGMIAVIVTTSLMMLWWAEPGWGVHIDAARALADLPASERAVQHTAEYMIATNTARARDRELGTGDICAYTDHHMFPSLLWNERFSNTVTYIPSGTDPEDFVNRVERAGAKWVVVGSGTPQMAVLQGRSAKWQVVGDASTTGPPTVAFRRVAHPT